MAPECTLSFFSIVNIGAAVICSMALGAMAVLALQACKRGNRRRRHGTGVEDGHAERTSHDEASAGDGVGDSLHASLLGATQT